jgi:PadR family transcriptional regulator, regulatory protein PadR
VTIVPEAESADRKFQKELTSGISALVLLSVLGDAREPMYGYQIAKLIDGQRARLPMLKQGALYPVLRSLEANGLLVSRVEPSVSGPPRRYYSITEEGRNTLARWRDLWTRMETFVNDIMKEAPDDKDR